MSRLIPRLKLPWNTMARFHIYVLPKLSKIKKARKEKLDLAIHAHLQVWKTIPYFLRESGRGGGMRHGSTPFV